MDQHHEWLAVPEDAIVNVHAVRRERDARRALRRAVRGLRCLWRRRRGCWCLGVAAAGADSKQGRAGDGVAQRVPRVAAHGASLSTLPGFMMPFGSNARLIARISSISTGGA